MSAAERGLPAPETLFPVKFIIGSRQILSVPKHLRKVSFTLGDLSEGGVHPLPPLPDELDGYRILSAPIRSASQIEQAPRGFIRGGEQRYCRHFIDMAGSFDSYMNHFSAKTRSTLRRKQRKLERAAVDAGSAVSVREFRGPDEIAEFLEIALPLSRRTYQTRMLDAGLPEDAASHCEMMELAAQDNLRCFLLHFAGKPISYLCLPVSGDTVIYAFLGYDPEYARFSPGTVLQMHALESLFTEQRYRYFDFTEGDGPHKALFGNRSVAACSYFLLRASFGNWLLLAALDLFDASVARARMLLAKTGALAAVRRAIRRTGAEQT